MTTAETMAALTFKPHFVYRLFDRDGALIYLGCTSRNPWLRISEHHWRPWYGEIATVTYQGYPDRDAARTAEKQALAREMPLYNIIGVPGRLHTLLRSRNEYAAQESVRRAERAAA